MQANALLLEYKQIKMSDTTLSRRGLKATTTALRSDMDLFFEANADIWRKKKNPTGKFPLNMAENKQTWGALKNKIEDVLKNKSIPDWVSNYTGILGHPSFLESVAQFMSKHVTKCEINPDHLGASAGSTAVVELCAWVLCNHGDVAMIPSPSYPVYTQDIKMKAGVHRYNLITHHDLSDLNSGPVLNTGHLETTVRSLNRQGKVVKLLLLTNPDNPTGVIYNDKQILQISNWCIKNKIHLIVNELYALSTIDTKHPALKNKYPDETTTRSFAKVINELNSDYLHMIYGFSKDFGISGMRVGLVYSKNEEFLKAYTNLAAPHMVSNLTQWVVQEVLSDNKFIKQYIKTNRTNLTQSYLAVINTLDKLKIPYVPARGSLFVWLDMSEFLRSNTEMAEQELWKSLYNQQGVLLTPGTGFGHSKRGQFRLVHSFLHANALKEAMKRIKKFVLHNREKKIKF